MIIPDANLLLYAYDKESPFHKESARWWSKLLSGHEPVGLCSVVVFSFLRLTTHPKVFIHPMTVQEATERVRAWMDRPNVRMLHPNPAHFASVCALLEAAGTGGNLVSDAQIAALALEYGAEIHTADTDFNRFKGITWSNPLSVR
jgi:toxin-antitoxin system PIN domain toxin